MKPTPEKNAGARAERKAVLAYLRRQLAQFQGDGAFERGSQNILKGAIIWMKARHVSVSNRAGGLGVR